MYVQFIETLSQELVEFFNKAVIVQFEANNIGVSFKEEIEKKINEHMEINNDLLSKIEKEIQSRIVKKFPELMSFQKLVSLGKALDDEIERHKNFLGDKKEVPVKTPNFNVSREKKHDKS